MSWGAPGPGTVAYRHLGTPRSYFLQVGRALEKEGVCTEPGWLLGEVAVRRETKLRGERDRGMRTGADIAFCTCSCLSVPFCTAENPARA